MDEIHLRECLIYLDDIVTFSEATENGLKLKRK